MKMKLFIYGFFLIFLSNCTKEPIEKPEPENPEDKNWTFFEVKFSGSTAILIEDIFIDSDKNIWVGYGNSGYGTSGIAKYDGSIWTTFLLSDIFGITEFTDRFNSIQEIKQDLNGNMWFGAQSGLYLYDGNYWSRFNQDNSTLLPYGVNTWVTPMAIDNYNNIYCYNGAYNGSYNVSKLHCYNGLTWSIIDFPDETFTGIAAMEFDSNNVLWVSLISYTSNYQSIASYENSNWTIYNEAPTGSFSSIAIDKAGNKWFASGNGIFKFDGINWSSYKTDIWFRDIALDKEDNLWAVADGIDHFFKFDGTVWETYEKHSSNLDYSYDEIAIDENNNVWIGVWANTNSIAVFNPNGVNL